MAKQFPQSLQNHLDRGAFVILCHFCKLKKRNDTCEKNLILTPLWLGCKRAKA